MIEVVGIRFKNGARMYYFNPQNIFYQKETNVIVETKNGFEVGIVGSANQKISEDDVVLPLKNVVRKVTEEDEKKLKKNQELEKKAKDIFVKQIAEEQLDLQLVEVHYNFDATYAIFNYTAEERVDFRNLVKKLAQSLRVRIEMHQINMREKARLIGGIGPCGYDLCCSAFLHDLHGSTIKMVKNQRLTLVPERISGLCGKLLCCLRYENDIYTELAEILPDINQVIKTPDGIGKVVYLNVLNQKIDVLLKDSQGVQIKKQYHYDDLKDILLTENIEATKKTAQTSAPEEANLQQFENDSSDMIDLINEQ